MWNKVLATIMAVLVLITSGFLGYKLAENKKTSTPVETPIKEESTEEHKQTEQEEDMVIDNGSAMLVAELEQAEKDAAALKANMGDAIKTLVESEDNSMFNLFEVLPDGPRIRKWTNKIAFLGGRTVYLNHPDDRDLPNLTMAEMNEYRSKHYPNGEV
jgi:cell division protein YceG involved in septum cleavage